MKLADAKQYVADKLKVDIVDLVDEDVMYALRRDLGIGMVTPEAGGPEGIRAKCRVADLLDIEINSVQRFKSLMMS
jgi:dimethylamine--corrinoid protein Co-methyltransferase